MVGEGVVVVVCSLPRLVGDFIGHKSRSVPSWKLWTLWSSISSCQRHLRRQSVAILARVGMSHSAGLTVVGSVVVVV